jgi:hypothetical protein
MSKASPAGRYTLDLRQAGRGCTLVISGSYEEVLEEGLAHECKAHETQTSPDRIKAMVLSLMKLDHYEWLWPDDHNQDRQETSHHASSPWP